MVQKLCIGKLYAIKNSGLVKKVATLKIIHEKFRGTSARKEEMARSFYEQFDEAIRYNKEIKQHVHKAQHDLTPLSVQRIFKDIPNEDVEVRSFFECPQIQ